MLLAKGDIVLVPFPFTDLTQIKLRLAVVLWVDSVGNDMTVCFISSQNVTALSSEEFAINSGEPEFAGTGLKVTSKVRVSRMVTIERSLITRRLGKLGINHLQRLNSLLIQVFQI